MNTQVRLSTKNGFKRDAQNKLTVDPTIVEAYCPFCEESVIGKWIDRNTIKLVKKCSHFKEFTDASDTLATVVFEG